MDVAALEAAMQGEHRTVGEREAAGKKKKKKTAKPPSTTFWLCSLSFLLLSSLFADHHLSSQDHLRTCSESLPHVCARRPDLSSVKGNRLVDHDRPSFGDVCFHTSHFKDACIGYVSAITAKETDPKAPLTRS